MKTFIVALQKGGVLVPASFELVTAARELGGEITTAILADDASPLAQELASRGGGKVLAVSASGLAHFNEESYANVLAELIGRETPDLVIGPATFYGKALFARLAAKVGGAMASDVSNVSLQGEQLIATRLQYGGSVVADIVNNADKPFFVTVRPKIYPESQDGDGEVVDEAVDDALITAGSTVKEMKVESTGTVSVTEADVIVAAGRGIKGKENLPMVNQLAESLGAAVGASRAVIDAGWLPYSHQVGQTGKTVNPKLYIALAISGAIQHLVGMRTSKTIVAINKDKDAPIFNVANYSIIGDAFEVVPALTKKFQSELKA